MEFHTVLLQHGKTATGFEVPPDVIESLGAGKRPPVRVTINGYTYRNTVAVMGGIYLVGVSAAHRAAAGLIAGDEMNVELELDTEPRVLEVPADLVTALEADEAAKTAFDALSYSQRQRHVLAVEGAKAAETRARRVAKVVETLTTGGA